MCLMSVPCVCLCVCVCISWCLKCIQAFPASLTRYKDDMAAIQPLCLSVCLSVCVSVCLSSVFCRRDCNRPAPCQGMLGLNRGDLARVCPTSAWVQTSDGGGGVYGQSGRFWCLSQRRYQLLLACCAPLHVLQNGRLTSRFSPASCRAPASYVCVSSALSVCSEASDCFGSAVSRIVVSP